MTPDQLTSAQRSSNKFHDDILITTQLIHQRYPELSKYLEEMTITLPDLPNPVINNQMLMDYDESLRMLLSRYASGK